MGSDVSSILPQRDQPHYDRIVAKRFCVLRNANNTDIMYDAMKQAYAGSLIEPEIVKTSRDAVDRHVTTESVALIDHPDEAAREALRIELNALPKNVTADFINLKLGKLLQLHNGDYRLNLALSNFGLVADHCTLILDCRSAMNTDSQLTYNTITGSFLRNRMHGAFVGGSRFEHCDMRNLLVNDAEFTSMPNTALNAMPTDADIQHTEFHHCCLQDAYFTNTIFRNCVFKDCDFSHARFAQCTFENCRFEGVTFDNTTLERGCKFIGEHSDLEGISIKNTHPLISVSVDDAIHGPVANIIRTKTLPEKVAPQTPPPAARIDAKATEHQGDIPVSAADAAKARWDKAVPNPAAEAGGMGHVQQIIEQSGGTVVDISQWKR